MLDYNVIIILLNEFINVKFHLKLPITSITIIYFLLFSENECYSYFENNES